MKATSCFDTQQKWPFMGEVRSLLAKAELARPAG